MGMGKTVYKEPDVEDTIVADVYSLDELCMILIVGFLYSIQSYFPIVKRI